MRTLLAFGVVLCAGIGFCAAEAVELPLEIDIEETQILLELRESQINITFDPEAAPSMTIRDLMDSENADGFALLEAEGSQLTVRQPHGDQQTAPRLVVNLVVGPQHEVIVHGSRLTIEVVGNNLTPEVEIREPAADESYPDPSSPAGAAPKLQVEVRDSSATFSGILGVSLAGTDSNFAVEGCAGPVMAKLTGGQLKVEGHKGPLKFFGDHADLALGQVKGAIRFETSGGKIQVFEGWGSFQGSGNGSNINVENWQGGVALRNEAGRVEIRASGTQEGQLLLDGQEADILVEGFLGALSATLKGGALAAGQIGGQAVVEASGGASVVLKDFKNRLELRVLEGSRADVQGVEKRLSVVLNKAQLDAASLQEIDARVQGGTCNLRGVTGQAKLRGTDCLVDLDFGTIRSNPELKLGGTSSGKVILPSSCQVKVTDMKENIDRLTVTGCDILDGKQQALRPPAFRRLPGERPPVVLDLTLTETAELTVKNSS